MPSSLHVAFWWHRSDALVPRPWKWVAHLRPPELCYVTGIIPQASRRSFHDNHLIGWSCYRHISAQWTVRCIVTWLSWPRGGHRTEVWEDSTLFDLSQRERFCQKVLDLVRVQTCLKMAFNLSLVARLPITWRGSAFVKVTYDVVFEIVFFQGMCLFFLLQISWINEMVGCYFSSSISGFVSCFSQKLLQKDLWTKLASILLELIFYCSRESILIPYHSWALVLSLSHKIFYIDQ